MLRINHTSFQDAFTFSKDNKRTQYILFEKLLRTLLLDCFLCLFDGLTKITIVRIKRFVSFRILLIFFLNFLFLWDGTGFTIQGWLTNKIKYSKSISCICIRLFLYTICDIPRIVTSWEVYNDF